MKAAEVVFQHAEYAHQGVEGVCGNLVKLGFVKKKLLK